MVSSLSVPTLRRQASLYSFESYAMSKNKSGNDFLPVLNPTRSFWIDSPDANPLAKEGSKGHLPQETDVCIIGSGITGISTAYHLSTQARDRPLNVVILEARDFCSGATGRNGGHLTPAVFIDFCNFKARYGQQEALKAFELEHHTEKSILNFVSSHNLEQTVDLVPGGHITVFVTNEELMRAREDFAAAGAAGINPLNVEWLTSEEMLLAYGVSYPGCRIGGHNLWPLKLVTHLYHHAKSQTSSVSLSLFTSAVVTSITRAEPSSSHRWKITSPRGSTTCSYVIHANNAYAPSLLPHLRGPSGIIPTRGQIVAVRAAVPSDELGDGKPSWDANDGFEYWFPRPVTSPLECPLFILGGGREAEEQFEHGEIDDSKLSANAGTSLRRFLPCLYPGKFEEGRGPEMEWTGIMGFTLSEDPFVGPVGGYDVPDDEDTGYKGQFIAAGYSGHGMPRAYACAEVVAAMVSADLRGEKWNAPNWLPRHYLTSRIEK
ncbi:hypothetical protein D9757_003826 [Collybiopsis confluens]|uniref:FAD dependent oxidoreductase domain-containing protein n=1 Tax=Collybiopsis confluens TaxID=2823264 RepID=A0A8H5HVA2_9AGAR|nr:hypothetical protein D9757_003826 [Collybiopsis confluens]